MRLKLIKHTISVKGNFQAFCDYEVEDLGLVIKGVKISVTTNYGWTAAMPFLLTQKGVRYCPLAFSNPAIKYEFKKQCIAVARKEIKLTPKTLKKTDNEKKDQAT